VTAAEAVAYAQETHRLALAAHEKAVELYDYVFPPWRWPRWFRQHREVQAMIRNVQERRAVLHEAGFGNPALPASDKQLRYMAKLLDEKHIDVSAHPDGPFTKEQASEIIDALQAGTYDPAKYRVPF